MFTVEERDGVRARLLAVAGADPRVVAGAEVGSAALGPPDRWSDLDLTFGVEDGVEVGEVLADFTKVMREEFSAPDLFDVTESGSLYRVFLLPSCLQVDVSLTPAAMFGARGPKFKLLFGDAVERPHAQPPDARELFGLAVHGAARARFSIERGKPWQAVYLVGEVRDCAFGLACLRHGLPPRYNRGTDDLPAEVLEGFEETLVTGLGREELIGALGRAIELLQREAVDVGELAAEVEPQLRALAAQWG